MPDTIDQRVEAAARAIVDDLDEHAGGGNWDNTDEAERFLARKMAAKILAAADKAALKGASEQAQRLYQYSDDPHETWRDGTFAQDDADLWGELMREAAATLQAQQSRIAELEAALEKIATADYWPSQPAELNMPEAAWARRHLRDLTTIARAALGKEDGDG